MKTNLTSLKKIGFPILEKFNSRCWIAGGAITDYFLDRSVDNIDIFFPNESARKGAINKLESMGAKKLDSLPSEEKFKLKDKSYSLACIGRTPEETISQFDYTVCCVAVDQSGNFYCHERYFDHLDCKKIHYLGNYPNMNFKNKSKRLRKYLEKGYSIDKEHLTYWLERLIKDQNRLRNKKSVSITEFKIIKTKINKLP